MCGSSSQFEKIVAIFAPQGTEAEDASNVLRSAGIKCLILSSTEELLDCVSEDAGVILVGAEALDGAAIRLLRSLLDEQPMWSDLPFVVIADATSPGHSDPAAEAADALGNAFVLRRPLRAGDLLSMVQSSLKARRRQHEVRVRIIDLRAREMDMRASEQKFRAIADSVEQMIWSTRPDGFHDYFNDRWYEFTGVPKGSTDGDTWKFMFHPDDQARTLELWQHSLATGEPYQVEYRLKHHSGHYRWVLGRAQAVLNDRGGIKRWYGTCTDIDEQVTARAALAAYSERLEADVRAGIAAVEDVFQKAPVKLCSLDADLNLVSVSDRWLQFMGYTDRREVLGRPITDFIAPSGPDATPEHVRESLRSGGPRDESPHTMIRKSGEMADVTFATRLIPSEIPERGRMVVAVTDITARKRAEAARDKAEMILNQARKLETVGQLSGGIAHDFNNLLMAIRSSLELLERRLPEGDARAAKYVANAVRATERGANLTQRMLAFARKQDLATAEVDTGALIEDMRDLMDRSIGPGITVKLNLEPGLDPAFVDANQLEMAILNLCVNARDAMDGSGTVTIETDMIEDGTKAGLPPGRYVRIAVRDEGTGMDAATLAQAMEPFFTTKGIGKGTGLGLPMVYGLAAQSGGTFRLSSTLRQGTVAEIILPVFAGHVAAKPQYTAPPTPLGDLKKDRLVVLAVDDDVLVLMGTVGLLEDLGHEVLEAYSGPDALKLVAGRPDIDLIITDQAMPRMTGIQLAETIHNDRPDLPIILASGYAEMPEGGEKHIAARLEKPFGDKGLARVIKQVLPS